MVTNRALLSWLLFANTCQPRVCVYVRVCLWTAGIRHQNTALGRQGPS